MWVAEGDESWLHQNIDLIGLIAGILTAVAIVVAVLIYILQKGSKTLDYAIESSRTVASGKDYEGSRLKVIWIPEKDVDKVGTHNGRTLDQPRITNVYVRNTGKVEIESEDFKEPLHISVENGEIIDVSVTKVSKPGIYEIGTLHDGISAKTKWGFRPVLLNKGDWIRLQVVTNRSERIVLSSWMRGETRSMRLRPVLLDPPLKDVLRRRVRQIPASEVVAGGGAVVAIVAGITYFLSLFSG